MHWLLIVIIFVLFPIVPCEKIVVCGTLRKYNLKPSPTDKPPVGPTTTTCRPCPPCNRTTLKKSTIVPPHALRASSSTKSFWKKPTFPTCTPCPPCIPYGGQPPTRPSLTTTLTAPKPICRSCRSCRNVGKRFPHSKSLARSPKTNLRCICQCDPTSGRDIPWDPNVPMVIKPNHTEPTNNYSCSLIRRNVPICSGIIISQNFVLTACKHCIRTKKQVNKAEYFKVNYEVTNGGSEVEVISNRVRRFIHHPHCYDSKQNYNPNSDIGLVQLMSVVQLDPKYFAKIPKHYKFTFDHTKYLHLTNYNFYELHSTSNKDSVWHVLTKAIQSKFCRDLLGHYRYGTNNICFSYQHTRSKDNCVSDIGASIAFRKKGEETVVGLLINKIDCGKPRSVGGGVKLTSHLQWIKQQLNSGRGRVGRKDKKSL